MGARLPRSRKANYNCKFFSTGCYSPRGVSPRRRNFRHDSAVVFFLFSFFFFLLARGKKCPSPPREFKVKPFSIIRERGEGETFLLSSRLCSR